MSVASARNAWERHAVVAGAQSRPAWDKLAERGRRHISHRRLGGGLPGRRAERAKCDREHPVSRTLVMHWNGCQWLEVASPSPDKKGVNELNAVAVGGGRRWSAALVH